MAIVTIKPTKTSVAGYHGHLKLFIQIVAVGTQWLSGRVLDS